ncbi:MAG TPA: DNA-processing protein DprA [Gammaproteobacteria bacterium]|nr:DNA-processing protein DprA [Gammaproteobacteria bacterium]
MQTDLLPAFLHLYHAFGPYSAALLRLLGHFDDDPGRVLESEPQELRELGYSARAIAATRSRRQRQVALDLDWAESPGNHLICYDDGAYPELLRQIPDFPPLLYARGDKGLLATPQIAIVGSRLCTPGGAATAFEFAARFAAAGLTVTSGLALGIDAEAHRGALHAGGNTLAVIATGADIDYPAANRPLAGRIRDCGLIVSEFPLGATARRGHFPRRNRIISGLAIATLVVEAAGRSGSLITAGYAADQGREVFTVPGSIHNPQTRGCHNLIRDGATLVESPEEVLAGLGTLAETAASTLPAAAAKPPEALDPELRALLENIGYDPVHCDLLAARSGLTIDKLSSMLLLLELNDLIQPAPGGCYVRT